MHAYSNIDFQDPITFYFQVHSSNRIEILLILQLETDYFSSLFISESPTRSRGITQSSKTSRNFILHAEDKELFDSYYIQRAKRPFIPEKKFYTQKAKRSLSTSNHSTRPSKGIPGIPATRPSKGIPDIPVIHGIQPFQAILHASRDSTLLQHSPIRIHILHFNWFTQKLH